MQLALIDPIDTSREGARSAAMKDAKARGDIGAESVAWRAECDSPGWCESACEAIRRYSETQHGVFTIELLRLVVERELPPVHDKRAWGVVTRMAVKRGLIERVNGVFFPAASSNGAAKAVYRSRRQK